MSDPTISLSPNQCFVLFEQSFNRVKYFSCISDNIEIENLPDTWSIKNERDINYSITEPSDDKKPELLYGFQHFMQRYLVRDCIESFALCLDDLFLLLLAHGKKVLKGQTLYDPLNKEEKDLIEKFKRKGLSPRDGKIKLLKQQFQLEISDDGKEIIRGLKDIRDCLAHHNGIVREQDGEAGAGGQRKFCWITIEMFVIEKESGEKLPLEMNKVYENEGSICLQFKKNEKLLSVGESLSFSSIESHEIAGSLQQVVREYLQMIETKYGK